MLNVDPWCRYPLSVQVLAPESAALFSTARALPPHIQVTCAPLSELPIEMGPSRTPVISAATPLDHGWLAQPAGRSAHEALLQPPSPVGSHVLGDASDDGSDSDVSSDDSNEAQEQARATGVAVVSPGKCADCGDACVKNWYTYAPVSSWWQLVTSAAVVAGRAYTHLGKYFVLGHHASKCATSSASCLSLHAITGSLFSRQFAMCMQVQVQPLSARRVLGAPPSLRCTRPSPRTRHRAALTWPLPQLPAAAGVGAAADAVPDGAYPPAAQATSAAQAAAKEGRGSCGHCRCC